MSRLGVVCHPIAPVPILLFGLLAELLTIGLAVWIGSEVIVSQATGGARYVLLAVFIAPGVGAISLVTAMIGARRIALGFAYVAAFALAVFSLFVLFAFYGLPLMMLWLAFAIALHATRISDARRA